jgi:hypothetical protein
MRRQSSNWHLSLAPRSKSHFKTSLSTNLCIVYEMPLVGSHLCFDVLWHLSTFSAFILINYAGPPHLRIDSSRFLAPKSAQGSQAQVLVVALLKDGSGHSGSVQSLFAVRQAELREAI